MYGNQCMLLMLINSESVGRSTYTIYNNGATVSIDGNTVTVTFNGDYGHLILISAESVPEITK